MFKNYIRSAWRNIKKHKGFSFLNAGGLALGMASCMLLLLYSAYHLGYDRQFKDSESIYIVENNQKGDGKIYTFPATPAPMAGALKNTVPGVEKAARITSYNAGGLLGYKDNSLRKDGLFADNDLFGILSYRFIKGNPNRALTQPNSIVITADLAKALFGNDDPMNKMITRNNKTQLMVSGVIENAPANSTYKFDYIIPWTLFENEYDWVKTSGWSSNFMQTLVKLKSPQFFDNADKMTRKMIMSNQKEYEAEAMLYPFTALHLHSLFENGKSVGGLIDQINLFIILAICILLIACVNFMNLSTARSEERAKEVGIRKAIGSTRGALIWQFITESLILSVASLVVAVILVQLSLPFFNQLLKVQLSIPYQEPLTWVSLLVLALFTGLISGSYPAFYLSSFQPIKVLKGLFKGGGSALSIRKVLVVVQFGFAVFLITATICIYRQIKFVQSKSIGYSKNDLVEIDSEGDLPNKAEVLINDLKKNNIITNATHLSQSITSNGSNTWGVSWPGKNPEQKILFDMFRVGYDFVATSGVKLIAGREFSEAYPADTAGKNVIINETAAKIMNLKNPIGAQITVDGPVTVVGVYKDFVWGSPYQKISPMISYCNIKGGVIAMRLNGKRSITANIEGIEAQLKEINPSYPADIHFVDSNFEKKFQNEKMLGMLANLFGGLAIVISCMGLFGLATYAAEQRTKEIGVRKVLGASVTSLAGLLSKDFLKLVTIGIVIAVPVSLWAMGKWLQNYEYRVDLSWWVLAMAGLITIVIALATVSFQAIKAALANPVKSLRSE
ncbi:ABC transporter permease [Mucilaginibacter gynuensis]|uniref:ABC transporter permease n=1 Tax=Mucilaginibacter gynuensis TaxID=1302236 RepID=A0ABP8FUG3_9SPHI